MKEIQTQLFEMQDLAYKKFHVGLVPTIDDQKIIGVRIPQLRKYANALYKENNYESFLLELPHDYYEENNLHGFLIEKIKDYDLCIKKLNCFLPYIDNWATCDMINPKVLSKHQTKLLVSIKEWLSSDHVYTIRFGIGMLMRYYLDEKFSEEYVKWVSEIRHEDYYVKMMVAWYFATALTKQYEYVISYFEQPVLEKWTHNKAIQKTIESRRISKKKKEYLRTLKIK